MYEVLSPIGAGGMGEVYRARDTKLSRDVALMILAEPDGRFLVVKSAADIEEREGEIVIVQNWLSELPVGDR
jgi:serine/threonine protein kinase